MDTSEQRLGDARKEQWGEFGSEAEKKARIWGRLKNLHANPQSITH